MVVGTGVTPRIGADMTSLSSFLMVVKLHDTWKNRAPEGVQYTLLLLCSPNLTCKIRQSCVSRQVVAITFWSFPRNRPSSRYLRQGRVSFCCSYYFFGIFVFFFASAAPQRPTCSYHANPAGFPIRNDMSLQVGEVPASNPGLQVLQPGALPLSHHIPLIEPPHPHITFLLL